MWLSGVAVGTYRPQYRPLYAIRYLNINPLPTYYTLFISLPPGEGRASSHGLGRWSARSKPLAPATRAKRDPLMNQFSNNKQATYLN
jgi:hypothetical protein